MEDVFTNAQIHEYPMKKLTLIAIAIFAFCSISFGQMSYSTKDKKAIKLFEQAMQYPKEHLTQYMRPDYDGAIKLIESAVARDDRFWEAYMLGGEYAEYARQNAKAIDYYKKALAINPQVTPTGSTYYFLANLEYQEGRYADGLKSIQVYQKLNQRSPANQKMYQESERLKRSLELSIKLIAQPYKFEPKNLGEGVNTKDPEYFPTVTVDGKTLLFTRRIFDSRVAKLTDQIEDLKQRQEDFFVATKDDKGVFQKAVPMPININTVNNEGAPTIGPDGRTLIFVACPDASGQDYGEDRYGKGSCDFFVTKKLGSRWTNPVNLPGKTNTSAWESQPSLSADGKTLYYIRGIRSEGGMLNTDVYVSYLQEDGNWSAGKPLPNNINTPNSEESVFIHPDGKTLYFASRGHIGLGGSDLYVTRKQDDGTWSDPVNLGYPINTNADDNSLLVGADGEIAFFASNRAGGFGDFDIYSFEMPSHLRPIRTTYFEGLVFDVNTNVPLSGKFFLYDLKTGKEVVRSQADPVSGEFLVSLPENASYALSVEMDGYLNFSKNFDLKLKEGEESFHMNIPMIPITKSEPIVLENIFFDLNKADLLPESQVELGKLYEFLTKNPKIKIEISGHTDARGDDKLNQDLSQRRADAVVNYLVSKGMDKSRLRAKGYGASLPRVSKAQIDAMSSNEEKEKAHQLNRRTEYKIVIE